jgi:hypothetical protein
MTEEIGAATVGAINAEMLHGYEVLKRESVAYDYEKVFWNSAFGIGLVGLGWVAVKLGQTISGAQKLVASFTNVSDLGLWEYTTLFDWVEGSKKDTPFWEGAPVQLWPLIYVGRASPTDWATYKASVQTAHPDWFLSATGSPTIPQNPADQILQWADSFYAKYGAALPLGVLAGNVGFEYARVWRMKRRLRT